MHGGRASGHGRDLGAPLSGEVTGVVDFAKSGLVYMSRGFQPKLGALIYL